MIVVQPRELLWAWVNSRIDIPWSEDFRAIGIVRGGCLQAVIAYNGFTGRSCQMHSAIDDPTVIDRTFVQAIFEYPFEQCGCTHILAVVSSLNKRALSIDKRCGFREVHRLEGAGLQHEDLILLQMQRHECRYLRNKDGKERTPGPGLSRRSDGTSAGELRADQHAELGQPPNNEHAVGQPDMADAESD